jgi:hypothetical protein
MIQSETLTKRRPLDAGFISTPQPQSQCLCGVF